MNESALMELARNAQAFSRTYVTVKESLMRAGVEASEASETARTAAMMAALHPGEGEPWRR